MAKALVLGATGHIGAHIVRALLAGGHQVRAAYRNDRFLNVLDGLPIERARADLDTMDGVPEALDGCEWIFHVAGYYPTLRVPRTQAIEQGITSTRRILEHIRQAKPSRVVFTSSAATIKRTPGRVATEADAESWPPPGSRSLYATVKIAMEHEVAQACRDGLPVVIVNPSICLGEYDSHRLSGRAILAFAKDRIPFYVDYMMNVVYTGDVGVGHVRAAERGRLGERYVLTRQAMPMKEFSTLVARVAGVSPPRVRVPYPLVLAAATASECFAWITRTEPRLARQAVTSLQGWSQLDGTKAVRELGLPQTPIAEAIQLALAWFKEHRYL